MTDAPTSRRPRTKALIGAGAIGAAGLVAGGILAGTLSANAAEGSTASTAYGAPGYGTPPAGGHSNGNTDPSKPMRSDEQLLTGTTKDKVEAAVKAKYPSATIQRTETDSDGVYESHVLLDGKPTIVQVGKDFTVTGTQSGPGGQGGQRGPGGQAPSGSTQAPPTAG